MSKRYLLLLPIVLIGAIFISSHLRVAPARAAAIMPSPKRLVTVYPKSTQVGSPTQIIIPSIGVNAAVENVGLIKNDMATPKKYYDAGWYDFGPKPGQVGNAIIDGHLNYVGGLKGVFWNLHKIKISDQILINTDLKRTLTFVVTDIKAISSTSTDLNSIFGSSSTSNLNIITCTGSWNSQTRQYSQRLIVYSKLVSN